MDSSVARNDDKISAYLRIASLAVAAYDWAWTLSTEYEIYSQQTSFFRLSRICVLFISLRYTSIVTLLANNITFFANNIPEGFCDRYIYFVPVMKCAQMVVAQVILFVRTWAISRRASWIFRVLVVLFVSCTTVEIWSSVYKRIATQDTGGNCVSGNEPGYQVSFAFYIAAAVFDFACVGIASFYLCWQPTGLGGVSGLARTLLNEGLLFFAVLQAANVLNLVIWTTTDAVESQSAGASMGYALTWIMAQRILIQLHSLRKAGNTGGLLSHTPSFSMGGGLGEGPHALKFQVHRTAPSGELDEIELGGVRITVDIDERSEIDIGLQTVK